ncbi:MAG: YceI family protein [Cyclobacteriaceae bacterium]
MKILLMILTLFGSANYDSTELELDKSKSTMSILGTSSIHDWESIVNDFSVTGLINSQFITGLQVQVVVKSIESGKGIMDNKTYDALLEKDFPKILFKAPSLEIKGESIEGSGTLSLAGQSQEITIEAQVLYSSGTELKVGGEVNLSMSDFGITPPTAMFGTLKTGDDVTIKYEFLLKK